jgi:hypothetical protein
MNQCLDVVSDEGTVQEPDTAKSLQKMMLRKDDEVLPNI